MTTVFPLWYLFLFLHVILYIHINTGIPILYYFFPVWYRIILTLSIKCPLSLSIVWNLKLALVRWGSKPPCGVLDSLPPLFRSCFPVFVFCISLSYPELLLVFWQQHAVSLEFCYWLVSCLFTNYAGSTFNWPIWTFPNKICKVFP